MASESPRSLLPALAASLGVHALVAWGLHGPSRDLERGPPARPAPATLTWIDVEAPAPRAPPAAPTTPRPEPSRTAERPPSVTREQPPTRTEEPRADSPPGTSEHPEPPPHAPSLARAEARPEPAHSPPEPRAGATPRPDALPGPRAESAPKPDAPPELRAESAPRPDAPPEPRAESAPKPDAPLETARSPGAPAPSLAADIPRADAPRVDLFPRSDGPLSSGAVLLARREPGEPVVRNGPVAELDAGVSDSLSPPSPQQLVEDLVSEGIGRGKVDRGLVHPYFSQLGQSLLKAWDADRSVSAHGLKGFIDTGKEHTRLGSRIWMEQAAAYGASGSPVESAALAPRRMPPGATGDPNLEARRELRQHMREQFRATRRAVLRVVQDAHGTLLDVQLVTPSHSPEVDREAVKDVRAAAERLPPPPPEALGGRDRVTSLWRFELIISITPPVPSFSFEFDEALGFVDARLPLDRRIYKRVRLLEVR